MPSAESNLTFSKRLRRLLLAPTLGLLVVVSVLAASVWQLKRSADWVDHTDEVIASANRVQKLVIDAETGARGYELTGHPVFLEPWNASKAALVAELKNLRVLVADNTEQQDRIDSIQDHFEDWRKLQESLFDHSAHVSVVEGAVDGKRRMDQIRAEMRSFLDTEEEYKRQRVQQNQHSLVFVYIGFVALTLLGGPAMVIWLRKRVTEMNEAHQEQIRTIREQTELVQRADAATKQLAAIVQSSEDAILSKSLAGTITSWNPGAEHMFGYAENEIVGRSILTLVPPELHEEEGKILARLRGGERLSHYETERLTKSGARIHVALTISPIRDAEGRVIGISKIVRDVTEQKRIAEAVRASEARFRAIFEQASVGIGRLSFDGGRWLEINDVLSRITGYSREELLLKSWLDMTHPDDLHLDLNEAERLKSGDSESYTVEKRVVHKDGYIVWVRTAASLVRDYRGKPDYEICVVEDISEQKHAEQTLVQLNSELETRVQLRTQELETANKELEAFSYSVSHDLRAPLRTVDGFSAALEEDYGEQLGAEGKDFVRRVRNGVQRMGELIDALLMLSRVTRADVNREDVDVSGLANSMAEEFRMRYPERDLEFRIEAGLQTNADPKLLRVALENLLENAVKYTSRNQHAVIEVGKMDSNGSSGFYVRDNGVGFDMQYVGKLFGAFQRLHGDKDFQGSGIGLATVQRIVRRHGGQIQAEGHVGRGATFQFTLGSAQDGK